jgi:hypothetical protein
MVHGELDFENKRTGSLFSLSVRILNGTPEYELLNTSGGVSAGELRDVLQEVIDLIRTLEDINRG